MVYFPTASRVSIGAEDESLKEWQFVLVVAKETLVVLSFVFDSATAGDVAQKALGTLAVAGRDILATLG